MQFFKSFYFKDLGCHNFFNPVRCGKSKGDHSGRQKEGICVVSPCAGGRKNRMTILDAADQNGSLATEFLATENTENIEE